MEIKLLDPRRVEWARAVILFAAAVTTGLSAVADVSLLAGATIALGGSLYVLLTALPAFTDHPRGLRPAAVAVGDVLLVTAVVWLSGGIESEYFILYLVPIIVAGVKLNTQAGIIAAAAIAPLYALVSMFAPRGTAVLPLEETRIFTVVMGLATIVIIFELLKRQTKLCDDLRDTLHHSLRRVAAVYDVAHAANVGADLTGLLTIILDHTARATRASEGAIFLATEEELVQVACLPAPSATAETPLIPVGPALETIATKAPVTTTGSPKRAGSDIAYIPLITPAGAIGALALVSPEGRFPRHHLDFLISLCSEAALAIENAQLRSELRRLAVTDHLTGLPNRREIERRLEQEVERSERYGRPLSVLMVDLDNLKAVNDHFGHAVGDEVLCAIANMMRLNIRSSEIVGRLGGDEFTVVLPETDSRQAMALAQRLIETLPNTLRSWPGIPEAEIVTVIGLSIGIASNDEGHMPARQLTAQADFALYEAKKTGKNCALIASNKSLATITSG